MGASLELLGARLVALRKVAGAVRSFVLVGVRLNVATLGVGLELLGARLVTFRKVAGAVRFSVVVGFRGIAAGRGFWVCGV